ncbi:hypothetical protein [Vallitalea guaymasensis]|uniref:hypothetical protein n=1 Tax=Vallitalea guaymasensis TaxID=1185412 RepID=UPI000DE49DE4|nr:hypothetical protein [Vallitalea guaymasensis]
MKRRTLTILVISFITLAIIWFLLSGRIIGKKPFKDINDSDVQSIGLLVIPPDKTISISERDEIKEIVDILNTVVIYEEDDAGRQYQGQLVQYSLNMKDGNVVEIGSYNPFLFIDEKCYKTKYEPCEELNSLGNKLIK